MSSHTIPVFFFEEGEERRFPMNFPATSKIGVVSFWIEIALLLRWVSKAPR